MQMAPSPDFDPQIGYDSTRFHFKITPRSKVGLSFAGVVFSKQLTQGLNLEYIPQKFQKAAPFWIYSLSILCWSVYVCVCVCVHLCVCEGHS